jgi:CubicO group peptidase (beta-lactamase class C family)
VRKAFLGVLGLAAVVSLAQTNREERIARAKALELPTPYVPPPGDRLSLETAGFAKILCSAVFVTGLDPDFAAENVGFFTSPLGPRAKVGKPVVDRAKKEVRIGLPDGTSRTAVFLGDQGCLALPPGQDHPFYTPVAVKSLLPPAATTPWPMGDAEPPGGPPSGVDLQKVQRAIALAFEPDAALTAAVVVTWKGRLIGERYGPGVGPDTPLESWSMGKSLTATLMGVLIREGAYTLEEEAPIPEWQRQPNDPRARIRIADLLHMSSGLRIRAPQDPDFDPRGPYPDHLYLYTGCVNSFHYAATRPLEWPPGRVGRYRNTDPVLVNYLVRLAVEKSGGEYLSFPRRALFDRIGIRHLVIETDPYGDFLAQGYDLGSGRDWARLGNLYLQDGVWNGERILPEGFVDFVSSVAPAWQADHDPIYGGFFWLNRGREFPVPEDAFYMSGAGGQETIIIPSHQLVVVRLGHYRGEDLGDESLKKALAALLEAVPPKTGPRSQAARAVRPAP